VKKIAQALHGVCRVGKLINFPGNSKYSSEVKQLKEISDAFDDVIIKALSEQKIDPKELSALIAHRFGTLLSLVEEKSLLWKVCESIIREQAGLKKKD